MITQHAQLPPWKTQLSIPDPLNTIVDQLKRTKSLMSERDRYLHRRSAVGSVRRPKLNGLVAVTLENYLSFGLGTGAFGGTVPRLGCAGGVGKGASFRSCPNVGMILCQTCNLVKYCSEYCQKQHWPRHKTSCTNPLLHPDWLTSWIFEDRKPTFLCRRRHLQPHHSPWDDAVPAFDCLRLDSNEGLDPDRNLKICFAASGDIRHLIKTVNGLPRDYRGQCDILLNDADSLTTNRNLVLLYVLLNPGPTLDELAEATLHLMYSAALTEPIHSYAQRCIRAIYDDGAHPDGDILFRRSFKTRGRGRLCIMQAASGTKKPLEMFTATSQQQDCHFAKSMAERQAVVLNPMEEDDRQRRLVDLSPGHRMAVKKFWEDGIVVPFGLDTRDFVRANPLLFSTRGDWLGGTDTTILQSWDITAALQTGSNHNVHPSDVFGCIFFYIKHQFKEFSRRIKEFTINIHITQFDPRILAKGLGSGVLRAFDGPVLDRVVLGPLIDGPSGDNNDSGVLKRCLDDWGGLLRKQKKHACLIAYSKRWYLKTEMSVRARDNPKLFQALSKKCIASPNLASASLLMDTIDAFVDHEPAFRVYIQEQMTDSLESVAYEDGTWRGGPKRDFWMRLMGSDGSQSESEEALTHPESQTHEISITASDSDITTQTAGLTHAISLTTPSILTIPPDVQISIFELAVDEDERKIDQLTQFSQVCRVWRSIVIGDMPKAWSTIDVRSQKGFVQLLELWLIRTGDSYPLKLAIYHEYDIPALLDTLLPYSSRWYSVRLIPDKESPFSFANPRNRVGGPNFKLQDNPALERFWREISNSKLLRRVFWRDVIPQSTPWAQIEHVGVVTVRQKLTAHPCSCPISVRSALWGALR
ncbi:hypothetical protein AX16_006851 [Volvariella volvacea WC 439]|nr:hypothetical protein AX16_006851 [Volvariella volvacea WC 439]